MSPKNHIVLKAGISYFIGFVIIWFGILFEVWLDDDSEITLKGELISFAVLQILTLVLTLRVKFKMDRNPIDG